MASSNTPQDLVEQARHVSKIIADYIDKAITTPPEHKPFQPEPPFDIFKPYERKADDPPWLQIYSNQAINLVLRVLEFAVLYVPCSTTVLLKDLTHQEFVDILAAHTKLKEPYKMLDDDPAWLVLYTDQQINQVRMVLEARRPGPLDIQDIPQRIFDEIVEAFACSVMSKVPSPARIPSPVAEDCPGDNRTSESEITKEEDVDDSDTADEDSDDYITDDSDESDFSGAEIWDDEVDSDLFVEELDLLFKRWDRNESKEDLPADTVSPLLDDPATQKVALRILKEYLDIPDGPIAEVKQKFELVLRELRKHFRVAHTPPFMYSKLPKFSHTETPVIAGYLTITTAVYISRTLNRPEFKLMPPDMMEVTFRSTFSDLKAVKHWLAGMEHAASFEVLVRRARAYRLRLALFMRAIAKCEHVFQKLDAAYKRRGPKNSKNRGKRSLDPVGAVALRQAVEDFVKFEETELNRDSPGFPDSLIKGSRILKILHLVRELECVGAESQTNKDAKAAADMARCLLEKWLFRSSQSGPNSLYVSLSAL